MEKSRSRRTSAPNVPTSSLEIPISYRSLRIEKRHKITKTPNVSVIVEIDSETAEDNNKPKLENLKTNKILSHNHKINNNDNKHDKILHKEKFDIRGKTERQISRESGIGSCSSLNGSQMYENKGFSGSTTNANGSIGTSCEAVIREQYWSCPKCCCRNWTKREKILIWIVTCLVIIICGLFGVVGLLVDKNNNIIGRTLYSWKL